MGRGDDGLRGRPVRLAVADAFGVGFLSSDGGKGHVRQGKVGVGEKGALGPEEIPSAEAPDKDGGS